MAGSSPGMAPGRGAWAGQPGREAGSESHVPPVPVENPFLPDTVRDQTPATQTGEACAHGLRDQGLLSAYDPEVR